MDKIIIYGIGNHAELVAYYFRFYKLYETVAFTVEREYLKSTVFCDLPVIPYDEITEKYPPGQYKIFIAVGPHYVNNLREKYYLDAKEKGYQFGNCITPTPFDNYNLITGENVFIGPSSGISPFVKIGNNVIIIDSKIGHHCQIEDHAFISSATLAGKVKVEKNAFIGLGSVIAPNITIGAETVIGLGCAIRKSTAPKSVYSMTGTQKLKINSSKLKLF